MSPVSRVKSILSLFFAPFKIIRIVLQVSPLYGSRQFARFVIVITQSRNVLQSREYVVLSFPCNEGYGWLTVVLCSSHFA